MSDRNLLLEEHLKILRLPSFVNSYQRVADESARGNRSYTEFLAILAEEEVLRRTENAIARRIKNAKFPVIKTLDAFDFAAQPSVNKKEIIQLAECHFIAEKNNVIFVGNCGTGKTHLSVAIGLQACSKGYKVFFDTTASLINTLIEAKNEFRLTKKLAQLCRFDLNICDELGYIPFDRQGTDLLFQLVAARYEQGSIIITTNLPFSDWTNVFNDAATAAAVIDRVVHHSVIIQITGESFRLASKVNQRKEV
jgi:DNA replication protein DnaC